MGGNSKGRHSDDRDDQRSNALESARSVASNMKSTGKSSNSMASIVQTPSKNSAIIPQVDGNRDPNLTESQKNEDKEASVLSLKNLDLGAIGWIALRGKDSTTGMPKRPPQSKAGQATKITLNTFHVEKMPNTPIYQFDVMIGSGTEKRALLKKVWHSKTVKDAIGPRWIYDGNRLAWSLNSLAKPLQLSVDLDAEEGRKPGRKPNIHRVAIRQTNKVDISTLEAFMHGRITFDNSCLEAINFLDHALREYPSMRYTPVKRSFFYKGQKRVDLGGAIEAFKGVYQSMRVVHGSPINRLSINVDVANGTFWTANHLHVAATLLTGRRDIGDLIFSLSSKAGPKATSNREQLNKKMKKLRVLLKHRGLQKEDEYVVSHFVFRSARDANFTRDDGQKVTIYDYFSRQYQIRLQYPDLPLVAATKKNVILPMELCIIKENQRYPFKLDDRQTAAMLKVAAVPPPQRWADVQNGLEMLKWNEDPVLKEFGIRVNSQPVTVDARLLPAPKVQFGSGEAKPGTSGRWDLKGKKFLTTNTVPLKSWSVTVVSGRRGGKPDKSVIETFIKEFVRTYQSHGGRVENKQPAMSLASGDDVAEWVTLGWNAAGNQSGSRPQILVFVLPDKTAENYGRLKRSADCRYGVLSQCMQYTHVQKAQGQYISNVCMKFNAKLGGTTARAVGGQFSGSTGMLKISTAIIGADVSHASPGAQAPSMAALTMSMDKLGIRYVADCQVNGYRVEIITAENIKTMLKPMFQQWIANVGGGKLPSRILYFRDGVSEGQYSHILEQEVRDMKELLNSANPRIEIPFVVLVGGKRHHVRFFPGKAGDRNENPLPGTLVETGITNPFENDFYLCSHSAIKGTARPMHYHVLLNEPGMSNEELQTLIYEHSYQFIRSTTPISQHPAIYYAHLASNRAIPHDPKWHGSGVEIAQNSPADAPAGPQSGSQPAGGSGKKPSGGSSSLPPEFEPLLPMPAQGGIKGTMWYI